MEKFKFLEHTADAKFQAFGKTLDEAFSNAALAMFNVITDTSKVIPKIERTLELESEDKESLLYDFLAELLVLLDTIPFLLHDVKDIKIEEKNDRYILKVTLTGDDDVSKYPAETHIKAMTYSEMFIKEEPGEVVVQVVVDI